MSHLRALLARVKLSLPRNGSQFCLKRAGTAHVLQNARLFSTSTPLFSTVEHPPGKTNDSAQSQNPPLTSSPGASTPMTEKVPPLDYFSHIDQSLCGFATHELTSGAIYEGNWLNGKPHGEGKLTWVDQTYHEGSFTDGKRNGYGTCVKKWGTMKGQWTDNKMNGQGEMSFLKGAIYQGNFYNSRAHGQGTLTFPDGTVHTGEFVCGLRQGQGTTHYKDGTVASGEWTADAMTGEGKIVFVNGTVHTGTFLEGR